MGVATVMKDAGDAVMRAVGVPSNPQEQDLLQTLKSEHGEIKALLKELDGAATAAQRKALVRALRRALIPHSKAEEKVLYAAIIGLKDKGAQIDGHEGHIEHDLAAQTLQKLEGIASPTSAEHLAMAKVLRELVEHHIGEEEKNVWGDAQEHLTTAERIAMNRRYLKAKEQVQVT